MTPNPFTKQYLMTAGPTPIPPAVSQAMAAPMLYHRAPAFDELYERVLAAPAGRLPHRQRRARLRLERVGRHGVGGRQPRPPRRQGAGLRGRQVRRALDPARARPTAPSVVRYEPGWGERLDPAEIDRLLTRRHQGRLRHAERDLDRHRARRPGDRRGRREARRHPRRRRRLRPRRRRAAPGRVGHRRRRGRLAEGAHVRARARLRVGLAEARSSTPTRAPAAATTSTGAARPRASARAPARSRPPCRCSSGSTSRCR